MNGISGDKMIRPPGKKKEKKEEEIAGFSEFHVPSTNSSRIVTGMGNFFLFPHVGETIEFLINSRHNVKD